MSLFGSIMGDFDDDPFFGMHMRSMRQMNNMMNSLFSDPFGMMGGMTDLPALTGGSGMRGSHDSLMPFGFPPMNINRLLGGSLDSLAANAANGNCHSYVSSSVVKMSTGPDGKPQVYRATASSRSGPGGIRETQRTVQDSHTGKKSMAIGHHIGDRAHIIEREQNVRSGEEEERQDFINLEEEEADTFNREWENKARTTRLPTPSIHAANHGTGATGRHRHGSGLLALPAPQQSSSAAAATHRRSRTSRATASPMTSPRRALRTSALTNTSTSMNRTPYSQPGQQSSSNRRHQRNIKTVSGPPDL